MGGPGWQIWNADATFAPDVLAGQVRFDRHSCSLGNVDHLGDITLLLVDGRSNLGLGRGDFHSVDKVLASTPEMIRNTNGILAVFGNFETQVTIWASLVVIGSQPAPTDFEDLQYGVDLGSQGSSRMDRDIELLILFGFDDPIVPILLGLEDPVEGHRNRVGGGNRVVIGVRLGLQDVGQRVDP